MSGPLNVVPRQTDVQTGVTDTGPIAEGLSDVLADTYALTIKTHGYHWNVEGPLFYALHNLTEEQYEEMFEAADTLAERIRAIGHLAPMKLATIFSGKRIVDLDATPSAGEMCHDLAADHERLAHRMHALIRLAEERNDMVTGDLAVARATFHEKAAWVLRAIAAE